MSLLTILFIMLCLGVIGGIVAGINIASIDCPVKGGLLGVATVSTVIVLTALISIGLPGSSQASDIEVDTTSLSIDVPVVQQFVIHKGNTP